jgi:hypothetical protein
MSWVRFPSPAPDSRTITIDCRPATNLAFPIAFAIERLWLVLRLAMRPPECRNLAGLANRPPHVAGSRRRLGVADRRSDGVKIGAGIIRLGDAARASVHIPDMIRNASRSGDRALPLDLASQVADYATRKRVPQVLVLETALASHLSPDSSEPMGAALS